MQDYQSNLQNKNDVFIEEWKKYGLKTPSVIRVHKIATLEKDLVEIILGHAEITIKEKVRTTISKLTDS